MVDIIQRLRELRQSSQSSVVTGIELIPSDERPVVEHSIESWFVDLIMEQLTSPSGPQISLVVLSGNAGDGKSYLLRGIRQRLHEQEGLDPTMVKWLLDATESSHQTQRSVDRLDDFFESFNDAADWRPTQLHVVAMNTGTVVRFMAHDLGRGAFKTLCDVLSLQLAIRAKSEIEGVSDYWERFDRVLVVDLDRRMLLPLFDDSHGFFDRMLATIDPADQSGFLAEATTSCSTCHFAESCPVNTNLVALSHPTVRQRLNILLRDVAFEDRIHFGPRSLWHLVYQMTVGGLDSASIAQQRSLPTCADMGGINDSTRAASLFFSALFDASHEGADAGGPALLAELDRVDPSQRFTLESHEIALAAGLSSVEDLRLCRSLAHALDLSPDALCGAPDDSSRRATAAVRRAFFMQPSDPDPDRHGWLKTWSMSLENHGREVIEGRMTRHDSVSLLVSVLIDLYGAGDNRGLWHLKLPWRNLADLYAQLTLRPGQKTQATDPRILGPDAFRPNGLRPVARELAEHLAVYPLSITVPLRDGPDVRVTWPLFRLLRRVDEQHYVSASLDPERVQNLERIGASLGAHAAVRTGVAVLTPDGGRVCEDDGNGGYDVVDL